VRAGVDEILGGSVRPSTVEEHCGLGGDASEMNDEGKCGQ